VSWSESPHVVVMIPGSEEQRGTDLRAALKGHEPFSRCGATYCCTGRMASGCKLRLSAGARLDVRLVCSWWMSAAARGVGTIDRAAFDWLEFCPAQTVLMRCVPCAGRSATTVPACW
jgi:hypothetical protein